MPPGSAPDPRQIRYQRERATTWLSIDRPRWVTDEVYVSSTMVGDLVVTSLAPAPKVQWEPTCISLNIELSLHECKPTTLFVAANSSDLDTCIAIHIGPRWSGD